MTERKGYPLALDSWGEEEKRAIMEVIDSNCFTIGDKVKQFEETFARYFGSGYGVMVNSGSSANLLAFLALLLSKEYDLKLGDEVLVPAVSWATTYSVLHQNGLKIRFVDIDIDSLNVDVNQLEAAITPKTKAIFAVNLLGNPNDFSAIQDICRRHSLLLIEDNCEAMGAKYEGKYTGTFGTLGTFSTYFSHHMSTMEGGMILTDDPSLYQILLSIRSHGWTRPFMDHSVYEKKSDDFYEMFHFVYPGYNLRPIEMEAAVGLAQLKKLPGFIEARRKNGESYLEIFRNSSKVIIQKPLGESSYFGFPFILKEAGKRKEALARLKDEGIEYRPIVSGNFTRNPVVDYYDYSIFGKLVNADLLHYNGLFIGNHHFDCSRELIEIKELIEKVE